jgi:apolipoprotein N-acyltransferase
MRAIETRRYVARAANSGVTGFIGANGETILRAPQYESVGIAASIPLLNGKSIYVMFGEWLVFISLAVSAFAITVTFMKQK